MVLGRCLDEPSLMAGPKPLLNEFGAYHWFDSCGICALWHWYIQKIVIHGWPIPTPSCGLPWPHLTVQARSNDIWSGGGSRWWYVVGMQIFPFFNHGFLEPPPPRWRLSVPRRSILNVSAKTKKAINDSSKCNTPFAPGKSMKFLRPQLKRFLQIGTILVKNWMSSPSYTSTIWHECKNCVFKVLVISKKEESHILLFPCTNTRCPQCLSYVADSCFSNITFRL